MRGETPIIPAPTLGLFGARIPLQDVGFVACVGLQL